MRVVSIKVKEISFTYTKYSNQLKESVERIGLSFPLKVEIIDDCYHCIDGNKRLSILYDLDKERTVPVIVINNGNNRSNDCWRDRNYH